MYTEIGTPDAISWRHHHQPGGKHDRDPFARVAEMDRMIGGLRGRLSENPEDLDGWMLLARTLKATQRFQEAVEALETANRISPDNPRVMVELVEARIFLTPDGRISDDMVATLEQVLEQQPGHAKSPLADGHRLFTEGLMKRRQLTYWESLLAQLEPGSPVAQSCTVADRPGPGQHGHGR